MKTFEGSKSIEAGSGIDDWRVIFFMYLLRAVAATAILLLFFYASEMLLSLLYPIPTFPEFVASNLLISASISFFLFLFQVLFYLYHSRRGRNLKRSTIGVIIDYALPIAGIVGTILAAYAIGAM